MIIFQLEDHCTTYHANFETKLASAYKPDDHSIWKEALERAGKLRAANSHAMQAAFAELGIPATSAPAIQFH